MKRPHPALIWILLPVLLGLAYAWIHPLLAPDPDATNMPPSDAVLVFRYRDFAALDAGHVFEPPPVPWSEVIAAENNVPGLPGVDRGRPVYVIQLPPNLRHDSALVVFPLEDPARFERAFMDPDMIERGRTRRAKELEIRGPWAAVGPDRDSVRRFGSGTLVCEERGESWSVAADVAGLAALALVESRQPLWQSVLSALGVEPAAVEVAVELDTGTQAASFPDSDRLGRVVRTWETARLWAFAERQRVEIELTPRAGSDVAARLSALPSAPAPSTLPPAPPGSDALLWVWVPGGPELSLLQHAVAGTGVDVPGAWLAEAPGGGALVVGGRASGVPFAVTFAVATPESTALDLAPLLGRIPAVGASRPLAAGEAPLTVIDTTSERISPEGAIERRRAGGFELVAVGRSPGFLLDRMSAQIELAGAVPATDGPGEGWRLVARFGMDAARADKVLGPALRPGGLFHVLAGGPLAGAVYTDGKVLRIEASVGEGR